MDKVTIVRKLLELAVTASIAFVISGAVAALVLWHQPKHESKECAERKCFIQLQTQVDCLRKHVDPQDFICRF